MKLSRMQDESSVDLLIRAGAIYSMSLDRSVYRSIAIQGDHIVALSVAADGLNKLIGRATRIVDDSSLTLLPAFSDTHNHLLEATHNHMLVPVQHAPLLHLSSVLWLPRSKRRLPSDAKCRRRGLRLRLRLCGSWPVRHTSVQVLD